MHWGEQERMKSTKEQLDVMTAEMNQLKMEKAQLETRTRILEQVVKLNTVHEARLHATSVRICTCTRTCTCTSANSRSLPDHCRICS